MENDSKSFKWSGGIERDQWHEIGWVIPKRESCMTVTYGTFKLPEDITPHIHIVMYAFVPLFSLSRKWEKFINTNVLFVLHNGNFYVLSLYLPT